MFIFTDIASEKKLKLTVGDVNIEKSNVLIDKKNQFYIKNFEEKIYPFRLYVNKGKVMEFLSLPAELVKQNN